MKGEALTLTATTARVQAFLAGVEHSGPVELLTLRESVLGLWSSVGGEPKYSISWLAPEEEVRARTLKILRRHLPPTPDTYVFRLPEITKHYLLRVRAEPLAVMRHYLDTQRFGGSFLDEQCGDAITLWRDEYAFVFLMHRAPEFQALLLDHAANVDMPGEQEAPPLLTDHQE